MFFSWICIWKQFLKLSPMSIKEQSIFFLVCLFKRQKSTAILRIIKSYFNVLFWFFFPFDPENGWYIICDLGDRFYDHDTELAWRQTQCWNCIFLRDTAPCDKYSAGKQEFAAENASGCFVYKPLKHFNWSPTPNARPIVVFPEWAKWLGWHKQDMLFLNMSTPLRE